MGRQDRTDFYRDNRDYASLLGDQESEEEEVEEGKGDRAGPPPQQAQEDLLSQECQEYFERRERLKELERQKLRRASNNGRGHATSVKRPLPYDNYGSFFGPSEPVVARRIIEDARAREEASKVTARLAKEVPEHRMTKGSSGASRSVPESRATETVKQSKPKSEAAMRLQHLKEARDYSFLFSDEDPTAPAPRNDVQATKARSQDHDRPKQTMNAGKAGSATTQKGPTLSKTSSGVKLTKSNVSTQHKSQERQLNPTAKLSKLPERPPMSKIKVPSQTGSNSNSNKTTSGPGRPPQSRPVVPMAALSNGKKTGSSSSAAQLKSLVAAGPKVTGGKHSLTNSYGKLTPGKAAPHKSVPVGNLERKTSHYPESRSQVSTARPDQKRPPLASVGHLDQRRPAQSGARSKQVMKPPPKPTDSRRMQKRPRDSESEDSFLDDDEDGGGDVSSMIRKMFGYNPNKYRDLDDEDDRNMEANFRTIQMEEKRSARIAREEDEWELALIEAEEREERAKKKRKQQR